MKTKLITVCMLIFLAACEKAELKPIATSEDKQETDSPSAKMAKTKKKNKCVIYDTHGRVMASGDQCTGKGDECGRSDVCNAGGGFTGLEGSAVVFEELTLVEFTDMWNSDSGREILESKGVYAKIVD